MIDPKLAGPVLLSTLATSLLACGPGPSDRAADLDQVSEVMMGSSSNVGYRGGSNYLLYDAGNYLTSPTEANFQSQLKLVIPHYHQNPDRVHQQLRSMCDAHQSKIAFVLWHAPFDPAWPVAADAVIEAIVINSRGGNLQAQYRDNIRRLLTHLKGMRSLRGDLCFNEVQFRFAYMPGNPGGWTAWDEDRYQQSWNLIVNTRKLVETQLGGSGIRRMYDLALETGGAELGQYRPYIRRLWGDYALTFGPNDAYVSIAWAPGRMIKLIEDSRASGFPPSHYAVDLYGVGSSVGAELSQVAGELRRAGELHKPLTIQETYYNDSQALQGIRAAVSHKGINLHAIMQWPIERAKLRRPNGAMRHFSMHYPRDFYHYLEPVIDGQILGHIDKVSLDGNDVSIQGWACARHFPGSIRVHLYAGNSAFAGGTLVKEFHTGLASEPAVNTLCESRCSAHRMNLKLPLATVAHLSGQKIYVHGISLNRSNDPLTRSGDFTFPASPRPSAQASAPTPAAAQPSTPAPAAAQASAPAPPAAKAPPPPAKRQVLRYFSAGRFDHDCVLKTGELEPQGYRLEGPIFAAYVSHAPNTHALYRCYTWQTGDHFVSSNPQCEGPDHANHGLLGFVYSQPGPAASRPLYRCNNGKNHLVTMNAQECVNNGYDLAGVIRFSPAKS